MVRRPLIIGLLAAACTLAAPGVWADSTAPAYPTGLWLTAEGDGVIAITQCGSAICGHFAGFRKLPAPINWRGQSECNFQFIQPLTPDPSDNQWHGSIIDPTNGDSYHASVALYSDGTLHLRGYLGISLLGHTVTWTRYQGSVTDDCGMK